MNSGCATGILIDISNVEVPPKSVLTASKAAAVSSLSLFGSYKSSNDLFEKGFSDVDVGLPDGHYVKEMDAKDRHGKSSEQLSVKIDADGELLENETFDFDELLNSPNVSGNADKESLIPESDKRARTLNSEQLAEVFKEATVVAVKLENYVHELNKTPQKSPNLTDLLVECRRSTQKKLRLNEEQQQSLHPKLEQEINLNLETIFDSEPAIELNETVVLETKPRQEFDTELEMKPSHQLEKGQRMDELPRSEKHAMESLRFKSPLRRPLKATEGICAPSLRQTSSAGNSATTFSRLLQQNRSRAAMGSPQKCGPIKATVLTATKQLKPADRPSPLRANSQTPLANSSSAVARKKTMPTVTRASSFNASSKIPTRPVLKRRNSTISPTVSESKLLSQSASGVYKFANRQSVGESSTRNPIISSTPLKNFRQLQMSSSPAPSPRTNDAKRFGALTFNTTKKFKGNDS